MCRKLPASSFLWGQFQQFWTNFKGEGSNKLTQLGVSQSEKISQLQNQKSCGVLIIFLVFSTFHWLYPILKASVLKLLYKVYFFVLFPSFSCNIQKGLFFQALNSMKCWIGESQSALQNQHISEQKGHCR